MRRRRFHLEILLLLACVAAFAQWPCPRSQPEPPFPFRHYGWCLDDGNFGSLDRERGRFHFEVYRENTLYSGQVEERYVKPLLRDLHARRPWFQRRLNLARPLHNFLFCYDDPMAQPGATGDVCVRVDDPAVRDVLEKLPPVLILHGKITDRLKTEL